MPRENLYRTLIEELADGVYFVDRRRRITFWNRGAERITGYSAAEVIGTRCADNLLVHVDARGRPLCTGDCPLQESLSRGVPREAEVFLRHKDGHRVPVWVRTAPLPGRARTARGAVEIFSDLSSRAALSLQVEEFRKLALLDPLTGLPNRRHLEAQLHARLEEMRRSGAGFGFLIGDIDHFKRVNDRFGHAAGDGALLVVARTIAHAVRPFDVVGRWGGEEFAGIFPHTDLAALAGIAERLRALVARSRLPGTAGEAELTISLGGTTASTADTPTSLFDRADRFLYESKRAGRNRVTLGPPA